MPRAVTVAAERVALASSRLGLVPPPVPLPMYDAYIGPLASRALIAACSTGIAGALPGTVDEIAERCELDPLGVDVVLRALTTLGYVRARRGRYRLTRTGRWLERERLGEVVADFVPDVWDMVGGLESVLRGGAPSGLHDRAPDDPFWRRYGRAMAQLSQFAAEPFAAAVPVRAPRHLVDLGGGPGSYAMALCRRFPSLRATVVELPGPAALGREQVATEGFADRVTYLEGNLFDAELPRADLMTLNNVLHTETRETAMTLLRRAHDALEPGGMLAVLDLDAPEPGERAVQVAALVSLIFYASAGTRSWTSAELEAMAREAGFARAQTLRPVRLPGDLILVAEKA